MCDGSHVEAGMHSMLPDDQGGSCDTVQGDGVGTGQKVSRSCYVYQESYKRNYLEFGRN